MKCTAYVERKYSNPGRCEKPAKKSGLCSHHLSMAEAGRQVIRWAGAR